MSVPIHIFIDTEVLDRQNYNFSSVAINAFVEAAKARKVVLLLPDPTRREIEHHIEDRSQEVVKVLEEAGRKAPFLKRWKAWPIKKGAFALDYELRKIAIDEWKSFLKQFDVETLGYGGVNMTEVMDWYDSGRAPFGEGNKRKEFPDALALAAVLAYGQEKGVSIAVVSQDGDFKRACELYKELLYFPSLPAFTETLLSADQRVAEVKKAIEEDPTVIIEHIKEAFPSLGFYHEADYEADIEDVEAEEAGLDKVTVIHIGGNEATLAFDATVTYSAHVRADDQSTASVDSSEGWYWAWEEYRGAVHDWTEISGVVKCSLSPDWKKIVSLVMFEFQDDDVCVTELPEEKYSKIEDREDEY
jgi:hypothetical protein